MGLGVVQPPPHMAHYDIFPKWLSLIQPTDRDVVADAGNFGKFEIQREIQFEGAWRSDNDDHFDHQAAANAGTRIGPRNAAVAPNRIPPAPIRDGIASVETPVSPWPIVQP